MAAQKKQNSSGSSGRTKATAKTAKSKTTKAAAAKSTTAKSKTAKPKTAKSKTAKAAALQVRSDESPWTTAELDVVRDGLLEEQSRLRAELAEIESGLQQLMRDSGEGSGDDDVDTGAKTSEREQEFTVARNARAILNEGERALQAIEDGTYGVCESCGKPIGKLRLQARPHATLCVACKQRQERH